MWNPLFRSRGRIAGLGAGGMLLVVIHIVTGSVVAELDLGAWETAVSG